MASPFSVHELAALRNVSQRALGLDDIMLPDELIQKVTAHFTPQMPYGTASAKTGDPVEFALARVTPAWLKAQKG